MAMAWHTYTGLALLLALTAMVMVEARPPATAARFDGGGMAMGGMKDMKCLKKPPTPAQVDMEWVTGVGDWYVPAGSQLDLNLLAADLLNVSVSDVAPHRLYYDGCIRWHWKEHSILSGFGGRESDLDMQPDLSMADPGWWTFRMPNLGLEGNQVMITLTDNETFAMLYACWPTIGGGSGEASWDLIATVPKLPDATMKKIWAHAKSLGFSEKHFTGLRFDTCA